MFKVKSSSPDNSDGENKTREPKQRILQCSMPIKTNSKKTTHHVRLEEFYNADRIRVKNLGSSGLKGLKIKEKVILVVGGTGSGKSTWINALLNYVLGVEYEDNFRFMMVDINEEWKRSQAHSQTQGINIYTLHHMEGMAVDFTLTIVDTPGFGDTRGMEKDREIQQQIHALFDAEKGLIDHIDAVGFVIQSSAARLTLSQRHIFDSILTLFGRDIAENILLLFTFADAKKPQALSAVKENRIPYQEFFKFNNSAIFHDDDDEEEDPEVESFNQLFWKFGMKNFAQFFVCLQNIPTKSLFLTRDVLQQREQLERNVEHMRQQVTQAIEVFEKLRQEENRLQKALEDIEANKEYTMMYPMVTNRRKDTNTHSCLSCDYTCFEGCTCAKHDDMMTCSAMDQSQDPPSCRYCPNRCPWDMHRILPYSFTEGISMKRVTIDDIKERHERATREKLNREQVIRKIRNELDAVEAQIKSNLSEITLSLEKLNQIALRPNHFSQIDYLDVLIQSEKDRGKPDWKNRVKRLKIFRDKAQAMYAIAQGQYDPLGQYRQ